MNKYDLIIVGAGASGLSAGVSALKSGIKSVLILEKEDVLGGNLIDVRDLIKEQNLRMKIKSWPCTQMVELDQVSYKGL